MTSQLLLCLFFLSSLPIEAVFQRFDSIPRYDSLDKAASVLIRTMASRVDPESEPESRTMMLYEIAANGSVVWNRDSLYRLIAGRMTDEAGLALFDDSYDRYLIEELGVYPSDKISHAAIADYAENMAIPYIVGVSIEPESSRPETRQYRLTMHVIDARARRTVWTGHAGFELQEKDPLILW